MWENTRWCESCASVRPGTGNEMSEGQDPARMVFAPCQMLGRLEMEMMDSACLCRNLFSACDPEWLDNWVLFGTIGGSDWHSFRHCMRVRCAYYRIPST